MSSHNCIYEILSSGGTTGSMSLDCAGGDATSAVNLTPDGFHVFLHYGLIAVGVIFTLYILFNFFSIADQWERIVVLRLGKFKDVKGPGIFFMVPFIDSIADRVSIQLQIKEVKAERTLTKDTVPVDIKAIIAWKVTDPKAAVLDISDYEDSINRVSQVVLREVIGSCLFTELLSDRDSVDLKIQEAITRKTAGWGVELKSVDIQDLEIPKDLQESMSREAQAEREKHARVILGQSEVDIAKQLVEAAKIYEQDAVAIQLRAMNIIYETTKERGSTILIPTMLADALGKVITKQ